MGIAKISKEEFIERSIDKYGDSFNYSKVDYKNITTKIILICNKCGMEINTTPSNHLHVVYGCPTCSAKFVGMDKRNTVENFIEQSKKKFGNKFKYDNTEYIDAVTLVTIFCNDCQKEFTIIPKNHLKRSETGCPYCNKEIVREKCKTPHDSSKYITTIEQFIEKAKSIHGDKYNYDEFVYINKDTKSKVFRNICKNIFLITPRNHIFSRKSGCSNCSKNKKKTIEEVREFLKEINYTLLETEYKNNSTDMHIICDKDHHIYMRYNNLRDGKRCKYCVKENKVGPNHHWWKPDRILLAIGKRLHSFSHSHIRRLLNLIGLPKEYKTCDYLKYSPIELDSYFLQNYPEWNLMRNKVIKFDIHHKCEIQLFVKVGIYDISIINAKDNLMPLSVRDHKKHHSKNKPNKEKFLEYLKLKNIEINEEILEKLYN